MSTDESARRLREARERAGLTQRAAAGRLGVHYGSLNRYEQGRMKVPADLLTRAEALVADTATGVSTASTDSPTIPISREDLAAARARLETTVEWLDSLGDMVSALGRNVHGIGDSLAALRGTLDKATRGVDAVATGTLGPTDPEARFAAARASAARARERAGGQGTTTNPPPPGEAAGGS